MSEWLSTFFIQQNIWVNCSNSLTWIVRPSKGMMIPLTFTIIHGLVVGWGRYNLPRNIISNMLIEFPHRKPSCPRRLLWDPPHLHHFGASKKTHRRSRRRGRPIRCGSPNWDNSWSGRLAIHRYFTHVHVCITMSPNHHSGYKPFPNGWFILLYPHYMCFVFH